MSSVVGMSRPHLWRAEAYRPDVSLRVGGRRPHAAQLRVAAARPVAGAKHAQWGLRIATHTSTTTLTGVSFSTSVHLNFQSPSYPRMACNIHTHHRAVSLPLKFHQATLQLNACTTPVCRPT